MAQITISPTALSASYKSQTIQNVLKVTCSGIKTSGGTYAEKQSLSGSTWVSENVGWFQPNFSRLNTAQTTSIVLSVMENNTSAQRKGRFRIVAEDASTTATVSSNWCEFTQSGYTVSDVTFNVEPMSKTLPSDASTYNVNWTASTNVARVTRSTSIPTWITKAYMYPSALHIEVAPNPSTNPRTTTIDLYALDGNERTIATRTITINQEGINSSDSILTVSPTALSFDSESQNGNITAMSLGNYKVFDADCTASWITLGNIEPSNNVTFTYHINANTTYSARTGNIIVRATNEATSETVTQTINVSQRAKSRVLTFPIWKDTDIEIGTLNPDIQYVSYKLLIEDKIAYIGKAYRIDNRISVRLNDVLRDYISGSLDFTNSYAENSDAFITAYLYVSEDDWMTEQFDTQIKVWNSWSYDETQNLFQPIGKEVDIRQYFVASLLSTDEETTRRGILSHNLTFFNYQAKNESKNICKKVSDIVKNGYGKISFLQSEFVGGTKVFDVTCNHKYCLYFRNVWGGYSWLLLNSASKRSDAISTLSYERQINNYTLNRSKVQYQKTIVEKVSLKTDRLSDSEAKLVALAMRSVDCYLHDLENDTIEAVNIVDNSVGYTNSINNKHKPFNYTINVELAKDKYSR